MADVIYSLDNQEDSLMDTANVPEFTTIKLSRDAILANLSKPHEVQTVDVPEWCGAVCVRAMTGSERDHFEKVHIEQGQTDWRARLVAASCCDEAGSLLFGVADVVELGKLSFRALDRVAKIAIKVNRLSASEVDDLEKKSEPTPGDSDC